MKTQEIITKIAGLIAFLAMTYAKATGGDIGELWLAIPAVMIAIKTETLDKTITGILDKFISKKLK